VLLILRSRLEPTAEVKNECWEVQWHGSHSSQFGSMWKYEPAWQK